MCCNECFTIYITHGNERRHKMYFKATSIMNEHTHRLPMFRVFIKIHKFNNFLYFVEKHASRQCKRKYMFGKFYIACLCVIINLQSDVFLHFSLCWRKTQKKNPSCRCHTHTLKHTYTLTFENAPWNKVNNSQMLLKAREIVRGGKKDRMKEKERAQATALSVFWISMFHVLIRLKNEMRVNTINP